ncbi:MAG: MFS transporter [Anaerolineae bacterium]|nr:MFS transporter [Anaerolineae bacterium]
MTPKFKNKTYKRTINAWVMYDWANSAFATSIITVFFPVYFVSVAGAYLPGNLATVYLGYIFSIALLISAVASPLLGTMADIRGSKKRYLGYFVVLGVTGSILLYFVGEGEWIKAGLFFILGNVGFAVANVFYDALLPHIAKAGDIDMISAKGFATGYLGGGLLLAIHVVTLWLVPEELFNPMIRIAFISVGLWWLLFTIPLWLRVPEPPGKIQMNTQDANIFITSFSQMASTFRDLRNYREVLKFLAALVLYTDGIGTIIKMGVAFGVEIGIQTETIILVILVIQFISIPFSFLFGRLAGKIGAKRTLYIGLSIYLMITVGAAFITTTLHFWIMGIGIAIAQGGTAAMTRSLGASMIPKEKSGEFFGFVSVLIKFAGIIGPLLFSGFALLTGSSRYGFLSLTIFFIGGLLILTQVDVKKAVILAKSA